MGALDVAVRLHCLKLTPAAPSSFPPFPHRAARPVAAAARSEAATALVQPSASWGRAGRLAPPWHRPQLPGSTSG